MDGIISQMEHYLQFRVPWTISILSVLVICHPVLWQWLSLNSTAKGIYNNSYFRKLFIFSWIIYRRSQINVICNCSMKPGKLLQLIQAMRNLQFPSSLTQLGQMVWKLCHKKGKSGTNSVIRSILYGLNHRVIESLRVEKTSKTTKTSQ